MMAWEVENGAPLYIPVCMLPPSNYLYRLIAYFFFFLFFFSLLGLISGQAKASSLHTLTTVKSQVTRCFSKCLTLLFTTWTSSSPDNIEVQYHSFFYHTVGACERSPCADVWSPELFWFTVTWMAVYNHGKLTSVFPPARKDEETVSSLDPELLVWIAWSVEADSHCCSVDPGLLLSW